MMSNNPILDELRETRARILAEHGDDLRGCLHSEFERLKAAGHPIAKIKQRRIRRNGAAKVGESVAEVQTSADGDE